MLVGRFIPGIRSLISIPAGAARMGLARFCVYTVIGSGIWNASLIGVGAALGTQHELLDQYLGYVDYVVYAAIAIALVILVVRRFREQRRELPVAGTPLVDVDVETVAELDAEVDVRR